MKAKRIFEFVTCFGFLALFTMGFKLNRGFKWDISAEDPTLWLSLDADILSFTFSSAEFSDGDTILEGVAEEDQARAIIQSIILDYNSVSTSYVRLGLPDDPQAEDSAIDTVQAEGRTIEISFGTPPAFGASGYAFTQGSGSRMKSCKIVLAKSRLKIAEEFKRTLTHEIGHCFDLDHNHADRDSIMSYSATKIHYLGVDDKIALTYLYPLDSAYAKEVATLGASCSRTQ